MGLAKEGDLRVVVSVERVAGTINVAGQSAVTVTIERVETKIALWSTSKLLAVGTAVIDADRP